MKAIQFLHTGKSKHDKIIKNLENRISPHMDYTYRNVEYHQPVNHVVGEIDLMAYRGGTLFLFEIKSNYNYKNKSKAIKQLDRARKRFVKNHFKRYFNPCKVDKVVEVYVNGQRGEKYGKRYDADCIGVFKK